MYFSTSEELSWVQKVFSYSPFLALGIQTGPLLHVKEDFFFFTFVLFCLVLLLFCFVLILADARLYDFWGCSLDREKQS